MLVDKVLGYEHPGDGEVGSTYGDQLQDVSLVFAKDGEGLEHYLKINNL